MSATLNIRVTDNPAERNGRPVWHRLHSELEEICEALSKEFRPPSLDPLQAATGQEEVRRNAKWHAELLQARLRKLDDAMDRLMSGSYGVCAKCERWIEDTKLDFDPAVAFCLECWQKMQTEH
ncbi:MAG: Prokaryotic dksA/traR C4-type zinc finger [Blastocatellia bacterium]|jgi:RNA polymerase-binding transcription factor DksA|nr:Prokaryotic dksA/traR C4-type zinc finger [Blastocatellia bacterium]